MQLVLQFGHQRLDFARVGADTHRRDDFVNDDPGCWNDVVAKCLPPAGYVLVGGHLDQERVSGAPLLAAPGPGLGRRAAGCVWNAYFDGLDFRDLHGLPLCRLKVRCSLRTSTLAWGCNRSRLACRSRRWLAAVALIRYTARRFAISATG